MVCTFIQTGSFFCSPSQLWYNYGIIFGVVDSVKEKNTLAASLTCSILGISMVGGNTQKHYGQQQDRSRLHHLWWFAGCGSEELVRWCGIFKGFVQTLVLVGADAHLSTASALLYHSVISYCLYQCSCVRGPVPMAFPFNYHTPDIPRLIHPLW